MADASIVDVSRLQREDRWEAEFYQPKYKLPPTPDLEWVPIGRILKKCQYGSSLPLNEEGRGFPIFRLNEIENGLLTKPEKHVEMSSDDYHALRLQVDDILFCRTNGNFELVGRIGMLKEPFEACFASYLVRIRPKQEHILPEYLTVYLMTHVGLNQIRKRAMRSNQVNLSASQLKRIPIPLAERPFQEEVSSLFNSHASRVLDARRLYAEAEDVLSLAVGVDTLHIPQAVGYDARLSEIRKARRFDGEYFKPSFRRVAKLVGSCKHGCEMLLGNIQEVRPAIDPSRQPDAEFHYVELADINPSIGIITSAMDVLGWEAPSRARRMIAKDDVVVSAVVGSIDKAALVGERFDGALASTGFFQFRSEKYDPRYLLILLRCKTTRMQLEREATGGILSAVSRSRLRNVVIPAVPQELQDEIARKVGESHAAYREAEALLEKAKRRVEGLIEKETEK